MRFGVIGYGLWGRRHANALANLEGAELAAISCRSEESAAMARQEYPDVPVYLDYVSLLAQDDIDAVSVVVPNYLHAKVGIAALDAGKDVLLEKPMAATIEECDELIRAAQRNNRVLTIGEEFRLSSQWGTIKKSVDAGDIGTPMHINISLFRFPFRHTSQDWRYRSDMVGSWILEEPIHFFDQAVWYMEKWGKPESVVAFGNSKERDGGMYDNFTAVVKFSHDAYAIISQTLGGFEHHFVTEVVGTEGAMRGLWSGDMDRTRRPSFELKAQHKNDNVAQTLELDAASGEAFELEEQMRLVVDAFRRREPIVTPEEGRVAVLLCNEAERSILEGQEIFLEL